MLSFSQSQTRSGNNLKIVYLKNLVIYDKAIDRQVESFLLSTL